MEAFGEKLKKLRKYKSLTLDHAAIEIGINASTLSSYENGYRMPGLKTIIKLAAYYETSIDYLLGVNDNENKNLIVKELEDIEKQISKLKKRIERS